MKAIVIYNSQTGFTKRYAEWIAEAAGADCMELSAAKGKNLADYEAIVFGGWARAGRISKLDWFKGNMDKWKGKKLMVFCVGASPAGSPQIGPALKQNFTASEFKRVDVFYCPGGLDYERMSLPSKLMMKLFAKMLSAKKGKTEAEEEMAAAVSTSYDISDRSYIEPILQCLNVQ